MSLESLLTVQTLLLPFFSFPVINSGFVRLEAGDGPCNGRVEVHVRNKWKTVCDRNFMLSTAKVICAELKCGTAVSVKKKAHFGRGKGEIWDKIFKCNGSEPLLSSCPTVPRPKGKCNHSTDVGIICSRYTDFRLMNGSSQCEGRVEIQVLGNWRTLCDSHWDLADANVLCSQLHCGVAMKPPEYVDFGKGSVQMTGDTFYCAGIESHLWNCSVIALGTSQCSKGKVASVVCSGNQTQSFPFNNSQSYQQKTPVFFSENGQLRLLNGRGPCSGRVEVYYNGTWGTICDDSWDLRDAHVVCRQLGCGVALEAMVSAHFGQGLGPIWLDQLGCSGNESHLGECPSLHWGQHNCRHKEDAGVLCSESLDLRLVSDKSKCSGWLEIFYNGSWGSVCSNPMDDSTVSVICRHLDCGAKGNIQPVLTSPKSLLPRWIDKINCQGQESFLWHCPSQFWDPNSCQQGEEAHITCKGKEDCPNSGPCTDKDKLQLIGGETPCSGRVEIWHNGSWGTVCDDSWDLADANVVCQHLGCGSALAVLEWPSFSPGSGTIWLDDVQCRGKESSLWDCPASPWGKNDCKHKEDAGVMCSGRKVVDCPSSGPCTDKDKLRLIGGETPCSGRVEIWHNGSWGTVCGDSWDLGDANVVCQQLGCGSVLTVLEWSPFSPGYGVIWLDDVQCRGSESSLWDCPARPWGQNDCKHEEVAGVMCSAEKKTLASTTKIESTTLTSTMKGPITATISAPLISGTSSLLWIVCFILGALLFLALILLGIQMYRGRIQQQGATRRALNNVAFSRYRGSLYETVYQEIDYYLTRDKNDLLSSPDISSCSDDSPGDGYDDAEEFSRPEIPPVSWMNEGSALGTTDEWNEQKESNISVGPEIGGSSDSSMGEDAPPVSSEDLGYDEAEIGVPQISL